MKKVEGDAREIFFELDRNGDGEVSIRELILAGGSLRTSTQPTLNPRYTEIGPLARARVNAHTMV